MTHRTGAGHIAPASAGQALRAGKTHPFRHAQSRDFHHARGVHREARADDMRRRLACRQKGGLFHPDRDYSVGDHRFHGQTDCGLASSLYQGRIRSHGLAARSHDFHRQLFHGDIRHSFRLSDRPVEQEEDAVTHGHNLEPGNCRLRAGGNLFPSGCGALFYRNGRGRLQSGGADSSVRQFSPEAEGKRVCRDPGFHVAGRSAGADDRRVHSGTLGVEACLRSCRRPRHSSGHCGLVLQGLQDGSAGYSRRMRRRGGAGERAILANRCLPAEDAHHAASVCRSGDRTHSQLFPHRVAALLFQSRGRGLGGPPPAATAPYIWRRWRQPR